MVKNNEMEKKINLNKLAPRKILRIIQQVGAIAEERQCRAFLVGGVVRDLLLNVANFDLDFVIEGDAGHVAQSLAAQTGGSCVVHRRFGTATVVIPRRAQRGRRALGAIKVDFAAARRERYEHPGALPTVEFGSVRDDLYRRDFTINAMAVAINKDDLGRLIDYYGGQGDLAGKRVRVLHDASFIDDPTRILRAVRFEQRLGFRIEGHTERLMREALRAHALDRTGKHRLRDELILMLSEEEPKGMLRRMGKLGALACVSPRLRFTKRHERLFDAVREALSRFCPAAGPDDRAVDPWLAYLNILLDGLSLQELKALCSDFAFKKVEEARLLSYKDQGRSLLRFLSRPTAMPPSELFMKLDPLSPETILSLMAKSSSSIAKKRMAEFIRRYRGTRLAIRGRDLEALGLAAGPRFKEILTAALRAKLDKGLRTRRQELDLVRRLVRDGHRHPAR